MAAAQYVSSNRQRQSMGRLPIYVYAPKYIDIGRRPMDLRIFTGFSHGLVCYKRQSRNRTLSHIEKYVLSC